MKKIKLPHGAYLQIIENHLKLVLPFPHFLEEIRFSINGQRNDFPPLKDAKNIYVKVYFTSHALGEEDQFKFFMALTQKLWDIKVAIDEFLNSYKPE